jgi:TRAP transporter 4TM/12TM fusion protein
MASLHKILGIKKDDSIIKIFNKIGYIELSIIVLCIFLALFHIYTSGTGTLSALRHRSFHVLVMTIIIFLYTSTASKSKIYKSISFIFSLVSIATLIYTFTYANEIPIHQGNPTDADMFFGTATIVIILEATRRTVGWAISIIALLFIIYTIAGPWMPGWLAHAPYSWSEIISNQFIETVGIWGTPVATMSTFIIIFLIFAGLLVESGMLKVFVEIAMRLVGRQTGGAAKATVLGSAVIGSLSGSAAADTLIVGSAMIPAMKESGYSKEDAGAIQAAAGTGAQFMPPIMGASAFIIATFLGIPYISVCKSAIIPALLFFMNLIVVAHFLAKKEKISTFSEERILAIKWINILKRIYQTFPIILIIYLLISGLSPMIAGYYAILFTLAISYIMPETAFNIRKIICGLNRGIRSAMPVTMACASAGIIVGCVMQSGLGYTLSSSLVSLSNGNIYYLLPMVLIASVMLGFGMTTVGVYIILATLVSPAMIELGVQPIAAHLFPFYFGVMSAITPPVAVAAYSVSGLTYASPWDTAIRAFKYVIPSLIIPFIFVAQPELCFIGHWKNVLIITVSTGLSLYLIAALIVGHMRVYLKLYEYGLIIITIILLLYPSLATKLLGLLMVLLIELGQKKQEKSKLQ